VENNNPKDSIIYGPVPSWRFGLSLGIDPTLPPKKCSYGCIYCQLGITQNYYPKIIMDTSFPTPKDLDLALTKKLAELDLSTIDIIMFSGTGEPTLNPFLSELIDVVRSNVHEKPIGILSNGSFINIQHIFSSLKKFDVVSLKLDSAIQETFEKINRPAKGLPSIDSLIRYYKQFKREFDGVFGLEIMLLKTKDNKINNLLTDEKKALFKAIEEISPDIVELEIPYRPPAESKVITPDQAEILSFANELKSLIGKDKVWVYGEKKFESKNPVRWINPISNERIINLLKHRPCRIEDLIIVLGGNRDDLNRRINLLLERKVVSLFERNGDIFYYVPVSKRR